MKQPAAFSGQCYFLISPKMSPLTGLGFLVGFGFYKEVAPTVLGFASSIDGVNAVGVKSL
jgi:hypothetical protein